MGLSQLKDPTATQAPPKLHQGLLIGEKNEICGQEVEQCSRDIERCAAGADAQQAHLAAAVAECKLQVAEVGRDAHDLLKLLDLQLPNATPQSASSNGSADEQGTGAAPAAAEVPVVLPSAPQLAQVVIVGDKVEQFLADCLRRQDVSIERLQMRGGMLKVGVGAPGALAGVPVCAGRRMGKFFYFFTPDWRFLVSCVKGGCRRMMRGQLLRCRWHT